MQPMRPERGCDEEVNLKTVNKKKGCVKKYYVFPVK